MSEMINTITADKQRNTAPVVTVAELAELAAGQQRLCF